MKACYIHVPFCKDICSYCDFTRCRYHRGLCDKWLLQIQKEIHEKLKDTSLETLYIGGGTPSALSNKQLETLLCALKPYTSDVVEYTIEANVDSIGMDNLSIMKCYGINRISLGVQTLQKNLLDIIHRTSTKEDVLEAIDKIHANGIHNISIDLMYGLPTQTMQQWKHDLQEVVEYFDISHISLYSLTIEEHSQFGRDGVKQAEEGLEADMFEYAITFLEQHGFEHYEISNFAKQNKRSLHNQMYWKYEDFIGIGCGASGKENHVRYENTNNLQTYFDQGASPVKIQLTKEDEMFEMLMMGLRTKDGVSQSHFKDIFGVDLWQQYADVLQREVKQGRLLVEGDMLTCTYKGMMLLNDVLVHFLD